MLLGSAHAVFISATMLLVVQFPVLNINISADNVLINSPYFPKFIRAVLVDMFTFKSVISTPTGRKIGVN